MDEVIRIATFNLENLGRPTSPAGGDPARFQSYERRLAAYPRLLETTRHSLVRLRAHVVALQEVVDQESLCEVTAGTAYETYEATRLDPNYGDERQQVVLSCFPIRHVRLHRQSSRVSWIHMNQGQAVAVQWNRPVLEVSLELPGIGPTALLAVHLKSKRASDVQGVVMTPTGGWPSLAAHAEGAFLSSLKRAGQALEVRRFVDRLFTKHTDARIVVLGDFNDTTDSVPVAIVRGDYIAARNPDLWDRELYPVELSLPAEKQFTLIHNGTPVMIDHILISRAMLGRFRSATVLNEALLDQTAAYPPELYFPSSDHAPVVAEFWASDMAAATQGR